MASGKTVLITGCSDGGLGASLAIAFRKAGWRVFPSARNPKKMQELRDAGFETLQMDVLSDDSVADAVGRVQELAGGSLDALVNNAGSGYAIPLLDSEMDKVKDLFEINVFAVLRVTRAFFPLLLRSTKGPFVINNTSGTAMLTVSMPFNGPYSASKAAAASLTEVMRLEFQPFGIKTINLVTGAVKSNFHANSTETSLPPDSFYNLAKENVEFVLSGKETMEKSADAAAWAETVVKKLGRTSPPHLIFAGGMATTGWIASCLPVGTLDFIVKRVTGLTVFEKKLKEYGGPGKLL